MVMSVSEMWKFRDYHYASGHILMIYVEDLNFLCSHPVLFFPIPCQGR